MLPISHTEHADMVRRALAGSLTADEGDWALDALVKELERLQAKLAEYDRYVAEFTRHA